jgi:hypothetical protein
MNPQEAELQIGKNSGHMQQECPDFESHEVWGSRFRRAR